ncbi:RNA polymerase sigma factor, sigma-70 family [Parapedobacter composti]|uniref:RNA polymerase sigma factor, sigma-70 family n=1 Tax=Parapedobacter composti TaxID=623281 RepID=A0A1I1GEH7_9SPHI|nr:sigma-70 family RNA polymerase sigma factor [Parapedobacter composti]SFC09914.1 RNA polymerase sigma factor, sigma-70 family [Parapedobacter composti]
MAGLTENTCWKDFVSGKEYAFRVLYDYYADRLFAFGCRYSQDTELIRDLIHDLFVDIHHYRPRLDANANATAYLFSSLRRKIASAVKKRQRHMELYAAFEEGIPFLIEWDIERMAIRNEEEAELLRRVVKEVNRLSGRHQEALYLRFTCELDYAEVADVMGVSIASCRTMVYRAVKELRKKLADIPVSNVLFIALMHSRK